MMIKINFIYNIILLLLLIFVIKINGYKISFFVYENNNFECKGNATFIKTITPCQKDGLYMKVGDINKGEIERLGYSPNIFISQDSHCDNYNPIIFYDLNKCIKYDDNSSVIINISNTTSPILLDGLCNYVIKLSKEVTTVESFSNNTCLEGNKKYYCSEEGDIIYFKSCNENCKACDNRNIKSFKSNSIILKEIRHFQFNSLSTSISSPPSLFFKKINKLNLLLLLLTIILLLIII
ncbi:hypothetical protein ACTFIR_011508 [Dictyostelium discoideum]